jgi:hypothetical protein
MLYEYLKKRFADTTVLTLQQLEDFLGVALPAPALTDPAWWANTGHGASDTLWSDAWTMANRTTRPSSGGHRHFRTGRLIVSPLRGWQLDRP